MTEQDVLAFVSASVKSLWALELLLTMRRQRQHAWETADLVREMRASTVVVREALSSLTAAGLIAANDQGLHHYCPASEQLDSFVERTESLYCMKPLAVINAIATAPNEKLRIFANAFRLKE